MQSTRDGADLRRTIQSGECHSSSGGTSASWSSGTTYNYAYDGEGSRVSLTENGQTTVLAYDAFGNLATEYGQSGLAMCGTATCYLTMDHLGVASRNGL